MTDLLDQSRRRTKLVVASCSGVLAAGFGWALLPAGTPRIEAPSMVVASQDQKETRPAPLDAKAFESPAWTVAAAPAPPAPATPPAPPAPPPPPLKLQLIGILMENQEYKAVLYDPDTNKMVVVATGQEALGHKIGRVAADAITIKDGARVHTLALRTGPAGGVEGRP